MKLLHENETIMVFLFGDNSVGTGEFVVVMNKEAMSKGKQEVGQFFWSGISREIDRNSHIHARVIHWMDEKLMESY